MLISDRYYTADDTLIPPALSGPGGLITSLAMFRPHSAPSDMSVCFATSGDLVPAAPRVDPYQLRDLSGTEVQGTGIAHGHGRDRRAALIAAMELLERYVASLTSGRHLISASARELGDGAVALDLLPSCSSRELANPACSLVPPDEGESMLWVQATDLRRHTTRYLPAELVYIPFDMLGAGARQHWLYISTGLAVGTSLEDALVRAIYEVVERDAVAVVWNQMMPLPPVAKEELSGRAAHVIEHLCSRDVDVRVLDAATDIGIPIAYVLCFAESPVPHQWVGASAGSTLTEAVDHALDETWLLGEGMRSYLLNIPPPIKDVPAVMEGALELGSSERRSAFAFFDDSPPPRDLHPGADGLDLSAADPAQALDTLVDRFRELDLDLLYHQFDRPELDAAGVTAVRVVCPQMQPLSLAPYAQYRGHPRLYDLPGRLGYEPHEEEDLNPWRQPFA